MEEELSKEQAVHAFCFSVAGALWSTYPFLFFPISISDFLWMSTVFASSAAGVYWVFGLITYPTVSVLFLY